MSTSQDPIAEHYRWCEERRQAAQLVVDEARKVFEANPDATNHRALKRAEWLYDVAANTGD